MDNENPSVQIFTTSRDFANMAGKGHQPVCSRVKRKAATQCLEFFQTGKLHRHEEQLTEDEEDNLDMQLNAASRANPRKIRSVFAHVNPEVIIIINLSL